VPDETGYLLKVLCLCPSLVIGSVLMQVPGSSTTVINKMLGGKTPFLPNASFSWVDIKDVSEAHIKCLVDKSLDSDVFMVS